MKNSVLIILGTVSLLLGVIGAFLPILPTTPFAILAAFLYSKGSPRMHAWVLQMPILGENIRDWENHGVIKTKAKILASVALILVFSSTLYFVIVPHIFFKILIALTGLILLAFINTRPSDINSVSRSQSNTLKVLVLLIFAGVADNSFAYIELTGNYWYHKQVYDKEGDNDTISRTQTFGGSIAWYVFMLTAIELNASRTDERIVDEEDVTIDQLTSTKITNSEQRVTNTVYGIGLRQSLANMRAPIVPSISLGYAKQIQDGLTTYRVQAGGGASETLIKVESDEVETDSSYASFSLKFNLSRFFGISGSVRTVVPGTDISLAKNNMRYTAGISWLF